MMSLSSGTSEYLVRKRVRPAALQAGDQMLPAEERPRLITARGQDYRW